MLWRLKRFREINRLLWSHERFRRSSASYRKQLKVWVLGKIATLNDADASAIRPQARPHCRVAEGAGQYGPGGLTRACPAIGGMFIYSGISLKVSRCRPKLSFQTKWRNRGRRSSGQKFCPHFKRVGPDVAGRVREIATSPKGKSRRLRKCSCHVRRAETQQL